jgi:hypothetical protein
VLLGAQSAGWPFGQIGGLPTLVVRLSADPPHKGTGCAIIRVAVM